MFCVFTTLIRTTPDNIYRNKQNNNMTFEHEITFNDDSIQYLTSTTNYLNDDDKQFLTELGVDLTTIKTITTYKL